MKKTRISVYIPAYNSEKTILKCIRSLKAQSLKPDEITVIDDGSKDRTSHIAGKMGVKVFRNRKNQGIAAARNFALKKTRNSLVAGIDSDTTADKDWLKNLLESLEKEDAAIAGGRIDEREETLADTWRKRHAKQDWGERSVDNPKFIAGNNFLCKKEKVLLIGGYNERFKTNYEDVDLSLRLKQKGEKIIYEPKASVTHLAKDSIMSVLDRHWRHMLQDYPLPDSFKNKMLRIIINLYTAVKFMALDFFQSPLLLLIDVFLFFHHTTKDFRHKSL